MPPRAAGRAEMLPKIFTSTPWATQLASLRILRASRRCMQLALARRSNHPKGCQTLAGGDDALLMAPISSPGTYNGPPGIQSLCGFTPWAPRFASPGTLAASSAYDPQHQTRSCAPAPENPSRSGRRASGRRRGRCRVCRGSVFSLRASGRRSGSHCGCRR